MGNTAGSARKDQGNPVVEGLGDTPVKQTVVAVVGEQSLSWKITKRTELPKPHLTVWRKSQKLKGDQRCEEQAGAP
jgi:hypothetical protein